MKYKFLLFDMDDTLFDFKKTEQAAFKDVMMQNGIEFSQQLFMQYKEINRQLWKDYEQGKIEKEVIFAQRFARTMEKINQQADGMLMEKQYRQGLSNGSHLMDGARELLDTLKTDHQLYVITNGVEQTQKKRLKDSGLDQYFLDVFISEAIGAAKPSAVYFDFVKANIPGFDSRQALVIGDSPTSDIAGGNQAGIDTCWLADESDDGGTVDYTYRIKHLSELIDICN